MATHSLGGRGRFVWAWAAITVGLAPTPAAAQISVSAGTVYTQNFDTLPSSGTANPFSQFDDTMPTIAGVFAVRTGTGTTIIADVGTGTTGGLYSFGSAALPGDRALGSVGSGNAAAGSFAFGVVFRNADTLALNVNIQYAGEQWRQNNAAAQTVSFSYITQTTVPTSAGLKAIVPTANNTDPPGYTAVAALDFVSPIIGGIGALDGNAAANRVTFNQNVAVNLAPNDYLVLYWSDPDHTGNDHGLSIDDLQVTFTPVPEPATVLGAAVAGLGLVRVVRGHRKRPR
jgi:hypothetical protein